jgi:hypothetical protein
MISVDFPSHNRAAPSREATVDEVLAHAPSPRRDLGGYIYACAQVHESGKAIQAISEEFGLSFQQAFDRILDIGLRRLAAHERWACQRSPQRAGSKVMGLGRVRGKIGRPRANGARSEASHGTPGNRESGVRK